MVNPDLFVHEIELPNTRMSFNFPDEETLVKYLALLSKVLILARKSAYEFDEQSVRLLDAVHNVPDHYVAGKI